MPEMQMNNESVLKTLKKYSKQIKKYSGDNVEENIYKKFDDSNIVVEDIIAKDKSVEKYQKIMVKQGNYNIGWVCDADAPTCMRCDAKFSFYFRRHHCRLCGYVACGSCTEKKLDLNIIQEKGGSRVCNECTARHSLSEFLVDSANCESVLDVPPSLLWSVKENFVSVQETPPRDQTIRESDTMALQTPGLDNSPIPMEHDDGRDNQTHLEMCAELNIIDASPIPDAHDDGRSEQTYEEMCNELDQIKLNKLADEKETATKVKGASKNPSGIAKKAKKLIKKAKKSLSRSNSFENLAPMETNAPSKGSEQGTKASTVKPIRKGTGRFFGKQQSMNTLDHY